MWLKSCYFCTTRVHQDMRNAEMINKHCHNFEYSISDENPHISFVEHAKISLITPCFQPVDEIHRSDNRHADRLIKIPLAVVCWPSQ